MTDRDALRERVDNLETVIGDADELTVETIWSHEEPEGERADATDILRESETETTL